jgi:septum formation protein
VARAPVAPLVLASGSPQRRAILASLGVAFAVHPTDVREDEVGPPIEVARANAARKARACARALAPGPDGTILAVDTVVATDERIWGKPPDREAAAETLRRLSGRAHRVVSGYSLVRGGEESTAHEVTEVAFRALDEATIAWYLDHGEWEGRAGGYAIQGRGAALVRRIDGDYLNVVGLPVGALAALWPAVVGPPR